MIDIPVNFWKIDMAGSRPLYERDVQEAILDVLEQSADFAPEVWSTSEVGGDPYNREELLDWVCGSPNDLSEILRRKRAIKYEFMADLEDQPMFSLQAPKLTFPQRALFFALGADLAGAFAPDIAWVHGLSTVRRPGTDPDAVLQCRMDAAPGAIPRLYAEHGPSGLGFRTFLGPHLADQIGQELLRTLPAPAVVTDLPWGGIQIDLVNEPWNQSAAALRASWAACTEHLREAQFFAEVQIAPGGKATYIAPSRPGRDTGGRIRN